MVFILSFSCSTVFAFEIPYPEEKGLFVGIELLYQTINNKQENQEGIFVFGQNKIILSGKECFDCVFETATSTSHFYFNLDFNKQALTFKGLKIKDSEIIANQSVISIVYPLSPDKKWAETGIEIAGKNIEIPDLGVLPSLTIKNAKATSSVISDNIAVPAGRFETLRVETNFSGDILNIPISIVQRTWMDKRNITIKMSFEFNFLSKILPIFDMEFVDFIATDCAPQQKMTSCWASIKGVGR